MNWKMSLVKVIVLTIPGVLLPVGRVWTEQAMTPQKTSEPSLNPASNGRNSREYRFLIYQPEADMPEVILAQEQTNQGQEGQPDEGQQGQANQGQQVQPEQAPVQPEQAPQPPEGYGWGYYWWWWIIIAGIIVFFIIIFAAWGGWGGGRRGGGPPPDDRI
jgi:hypothetical protein